MVMVIIVMVVGRFFVIQVECPDDLYDALATTWNDHPQYADLCQIVLDAETSEEEENVDVDQDSTLMNTFYRHGMTQPKYFVRSILKSKSLW